MKHNSVIFVVDPNPENRNLFVKKMHNDDYLRKNFSFISIDNNQLKDSELLLNFSGFVPGFQKVSKGLIGWVEVANGGSLLLNDMDSNDEEFIVKLSTIMNSQKNVPFGSSKIKKIDVRFFIGVSKVESYMKDLFPNHYVFNLQKDHK